MANSKFIIYSAIILLMYLAAAVGITYLPIIFRFPCGVVLAVPVVKIIMRMYDRVHE